MAAVSANKLELLQIADAVAREKSIDRGIVIAAMEDAIAKAARARYGSETDVHAEIDAKKGELRLSRHMLVVEQVENSSNQISLEDARRANPGAQIGDTVALPAGTATWTAGITVTKGISIIGAGKDVTVIIASRSGRTTQRTFTITASANQPMFRLSGLTIKGVAGQAGGTQGVVWMGGNGEEIEIQGMASRSQEGGFYTGRARAQTPVEWCEWCPIFDALKG